MPQHEIRAAAVGERPFDVLIRNARILDVYTSEVIAGQIGIVGDTIAAILPPTEDAKAQETIDAAGRTAIPGLMDSHVHIESCMMTPLHFSQAVLARGTTAAAVDPHEIANVLGEKGVAYVCDAIPHSQVALLVEVPSCVPAVPGLETAGATFGPEEIADMLAWESTIGLAEVMDYPGVVRGDRRMVEILSAARQSNKVICGHAPLLTGRELAAYLAAGPSSDHELMTEDEVVEKLRAGMYIEARYSSHSENVSLLAAALQHFEEIPPNTLLCTDDVLPNDLVSRGHMDETVRRAIAAGIPAAAAVRMATLHAALRYGLKDRGAIAPGKRADILLLDSLRDFQVQAVLAGGRLVAKNGKLLTKGQTHEHSVESQQTVKLPSGLSPDAFRLQAPAQAGSTVEVRVIVTGQGIMTEFTTKTVPIANGYLDTSAVDDLAMAAVVERHGRSGSIGRGLVTGLGMDGGAVGTTVAHDSHNLLVVGYNPEDMYLVARKLEESGGGIAVAQGGKIQALLELPVAGLLSKLPVDELAPVVAHVQEVLRGKGITAPDPLMAFLPLALPVIPHARLTDKGMVDVVAQKVVGVFV